MGTLEERRNTMRIKTAQWLEMNRRITGCPKSNDENWKDACAIVDPIIDARKERIQAKGVN